MQSEPNLSETSHKLPVYFTDQELASLSEGEITLYAVAAGLLNNHKNLTTPFSKEDILKYLRELESNLHHSIGAKLTSEDNISTFLSLFTTETETGYLLDDDSLQIAGIRLRKDMSHSTQGSSNKASSSKRLLQ